MLKQDLIRLSQSHLNLLSACPPMFQQVYLDGLNSLPEPEQQARMQWGTRFHLLMQQRELALPIDSLLNSDAELDLSLKALIAANPYLQKQTDNSWREAEHSRTMRCDRFLLTVIYDLLIAQGDKALIFDWKTHRTPQKRQKLANNWQTKLYLYVLAETSDYDPEQLQMVYWFVKSGKPESVTLKYDLQQHLNTQQDLSSLLEQLTTWLENCDRSDFSFPHRTDCEQKCFYRQFLLATEPKIHTPQELNQSIEDIDEVSI